MQFAKVGYSMPFCDFRVFLAKYQQQTSGCRMPLSSPLGPSCLHPALHALSAGAFQPLPQSGPISPQCLAWFYRRRPIAELRFGAWSICADLNWAGSTTWVHYVVCHDQRITVGRPNLFDLVLIHARFGGQGNRGLGSN